MDTGSEFAMIMTRTGVDLLKESGNLIKELLILIYQNEKLKNQMVLDDNNPEKLMQNLKNMDLVELNKEQLGKFDKLAEEKGFNYSGIKVPNNKNSVNIVYDKSQFLMLGEIIQELDKELLQDINKEDEKQSKENNNKPETFETAEKKSELKTKNVEEMER